MIILVPIDDVEAGLLHHVGNRLSAALDVPADLGDQIRAPIRAYDRSRGQYILRALSRLSVQDTERVLGIIEVDCYAPGLSFIFGQAERNGRNAFIALPRLRPSFHGKPKDRGLFRTRTVKEAIHELGHTYGLDHCSSSKVRDALLKSSARHRREIHQILREL